MADPSQLNSTNKSRPWAVVTGASSGIGQELARQLAAQGKNIVLVARRQDALDQLSQELRESSGVCTQVIALDLGLTGTANLIDTLTASLAVEMLVASAGFGSAGPFLDEKLESQLNMIDVNCRSLVDLSYLFGKRFRERGNGSIILFSSIVAFQGMPYSTTYAATKAFVQSFGEALAVELKSDGIKVLCVAPGPTASGFASRAGMKFGQSLTAKQVVDGALRNLGRRTTVFPGFLSKLLGAPISMLPRFLRIRIMGAIGKGMVA